MSDDALSLLSAFFTSLWNGLNNVFIPGTDWSISGFFIAIFFAGIIGLMLKIAFKAFNSHFGRGAQIDAAYKRRYNKREDD